MVERVECFAEVQDENNNKIIFIRALSPMLCHVKQHYLCWAVRPKTRCLSLNKFDSCRGCSWYFPCNVQEWDWAIFLAILLCTTFVDAGCGREVLHVFGISREPGSFQDGLPYGVKFFSRNVVNSYSFSRFCLIESLIICDDIWTNKSISFCLEFDFVDSLVQEHCLCARSSR